MSWGAFSACGVSVYLIASINGLHVAPAQFIMRPFCMPPMADVVPQNLEDVVFH